MFSQMMSAITGKEVKASGIGVNRTGISGVQRLKGTNSDSTSNETADRPSKTYEISAAEKAEQTAKTARLKAAREQEKALLAEKAKSRSGKPRLMKSGGGVNKRSATTKSPIKSIKHQNIAYKGESLSKEPVKKLNFKDIMAHASTVDGEKLKMSFKSRDKKLVKEKDTKREKTETKKEKKEKTVKHKSTISEPVSDVEKHKPVKSSSYMVQPMEELLEKQRKRKLRKQAKGHDAYEMDDFIVEDEEGQALEDKGYDRDEIWSIFNRGKKRQAFYDEFSDESDMEARGSEIFEEEARSSLAAKREDEEQERRLQELAAEKKRRKAEMRKRG